MMNATTSKYGISVRKPAHKCPMCGSANYYKKSKGCRPFCSPECAIKGATLKNATVVNFTTLPKMIEYGQCTDEMYAKQTVLETRQVRRNEYKLIHSMAGYESAGAAMRWTDEYWAVRYFDTVLNAVYGRRFSALTPAKEYFDSRS